ncbi:MAG: MXAN_5187 C-terminal domain-containing protein [Acidobacteriota bacterium]
MEQKIENPIDQDLDRLEVEMRRLKIEYDIYFNGGTVRPPLDTKGRVETTIKRLYDVRGMTFGQRFRYNGLVARYNVMREMIRRQEQDHEQSGRPPTAEAAAAMRNRVMTIRCHDPRHQPDKVSEIYNQLIIAKRDCGERIDGLTFDVFSKFLSARASQIKHDLSSDEIDFVVGVEEGRVKFTARAAKEAKSEEDI